MNLMQIKIIKTTFMTPEPWANVFDVANASPRNSLDNQKRFGENVLRSEHKVLMEWYKWNDFTKDGSWKRMLTIRSYRDRIDFTDQRRLKQKKFNHQKALVVPGGNGDIPHGEWLRMLLPWTKSTAKTKIGRRDNKLLTREKKYSGKSRSYFVERETVRKEERSLLLHLNDTRNMKRGY